MNQVSDTPASLGFRMPAEWEPHEATWMAWPHEATDWPGKFSTVPWLYGEIVRHLSRVEKVRILVQNSAAAHKARRVLKKCGAELNAVEFFECATNRSWTRDYCPIFVKRDDGEIGALDWHFNGWAKYDNWREDDAVPEQLARTLNLKRWTPFMRERRTVLEGGSIDVNGRGSILTTEECLLSAVQARNPELSRRDIEALFRDFLGRASYALVAERNCWRRYTRPR